MQVFPELHAEANVGDTLLIGALANQAALHGVLAQIEALGLELVESRRLPAEDEGPGIRQMAPGTIPDLQTHLETLLDCIWSCESEWDFDDRLDLATRSQGRAA